MKAVRFNHLLHSIAPVHTCTRSRRVPHEDVNIHFCSPGPFYVEYFISVSVSVLLGTFHFCSPCPFYLEHFISARQVRFTRNSSIYCYREKIQTSLPRPEITGGKLGIMEETHNTQVGHCCCCCCCCCAVSVLGLLSPQAYQTKKKKKKKKKGGFFKTKYPPRIDK